MISPDIAKADIPRLGQLLKEEEDTGIQILVVDALRLLGADAQSQSTALLAALRSDDPGLSAAAANALGDIFQKQKAPNVRRELERAAAAPDENVAAAAQAALKKLLP
jgi:HEAT repeat protein